MPVKPPGSNHLSIIAIPAGRDSQADKRSAGTFGGRRVATIPEGDQGGQKSQVIARDKGRHPGVNERPRPADPHKAALATAYTGGVSALRGLRVKTTTKQPRGAVDLCGAIETFTQNEFAVKFEDELTQWNKHFNMVEGEFATPFGRGDAGYFYDLKEELELMRSDISDVIKRMKPVISSNDGDQLALVLEKAKAAKLKLEDLDASLSKSHFPIFKSRLE